MKNQQLPISVKGHVKIEDDLGEVLLDKDNAIHPQNMARVIARALAREDNYYIHRIAYGNGGTIVDAVQQITYRTPNDGIADGGTWTSRMYNETYSEIVDDSNVDVSTGVGANPTGDPTTTPNVQDGPGVYSNGDNGLLSEVVISATLNPGEPTGQLASDNAGPTENTESDFSFDEIALFTAGAPAAPTAGFQQIDVGNKSTTDVTGLSPSTTYTFDIVVDGGSTQNISIVTPATGTGTAGAITFADVITLINAEVSGATASISNGTNVQTFGFLQFTSGTTGPTSSIAITDPGAPYPSDYLFSNIVGFPAAGGVQTAVAGLNAGIQNAPTAPATERERMLTHIIFSPVLKSANRTLTVTYTLTVQVAPTV